MVKEILKSPLLSEDDADFLVNLFEGTYVEDSMIVSRHNENLSASTLGGIAIAAVLLTVPQVPWLFQIPSLIYIGSNMFFILYKRINQRRFQRLMQCLALFMKMMKVMQDLKTGLTKSLQFIQEVELIARGFTLPNLVTHLSMKTVPGHPSALLCPALRTELKNVLHTLCAIYKENTLEIRKCYPLNPVIDNPSHYLACSPDLPQTVDNEYIPVVVIRNLLQQCNSQLSEMLRRLALCFLKPSNGILAKQVAALCTNLTPKCEQLQEQVYIALNYFSSWKVIDKDVVSKRLQENDLSTALHSLERHLRAAALLTEDLHNQILPNTMMLLNNECKAINVCYDLIQSLVQRESKPTISAQTEKREPSILDSPFTECKEKSIPLFGAWEPPIQDEILEADVNEDHCEDSDVYDEYILFHSAEERNAAKKEMAAKSQRLYRELKQVLQSKAAEWKEREAKVMQRLGKSSEAAQHQEYWENHQDTEAKSDEKVNSHRTETNDLEHIVDEKNVGNSDNIQISDNENTFCTAEVLDESKNSENSPQTASDDTNLEDLQRAQIGKFDVSCARNTACNFSMQAALVAQIRSIALQRPMQNEEEFIGDSDDDM